MIVELNKTYVTRSGMRVYISSYWEGPDVMIGYGSDGLHHRFNRINGTSWNYSFGGSSFNEPHLDLVGEAMGLDDLKEEYLAYAAHVAEQRRVYVSLDGDPDQYEKYRAWNRKNRPPGPLRPGLYAKDYDEVRS